MAARDLEASAAPSAKFLQARITALSTTLIKRLENIFAQTLDETTAPGTDEVNPPALTDTAVKQLQLDVESTALIRAAEELMVLTRTMKELWLFGGLNTIPSEDQQQNGQEAEMKRKMENDEHFVVDGLMRYLAELGNAKNVRSTTTTMPLNVVHETSHVTTHSVQVQWSTGSKFAHISRGSHRSVPKFPKYNLNISSSRHIYLAPESMTNSLISTEQAVCVLKQSASAVKASCHLRTFRTPNLEPLKACNGAAGSSKVPSLAWLWQRR